MKYMMIFMKKNKVEKILDFYLIRYEKVLDRIKQTKKLRRKADYQLINVYNFSVFRQTMKKRQRNIHSVHSI